ncbi:MAG: hypothetical protein V4480_02690 [Patescibacteria group bacterium]
MTPTIFPRELVQDARSGFALLIAIIFTSVVLALGASLLDVAYKQVLLSSSAKQSQYAFYNADSALECALYWDQTSNAFSYSAPAPGGSIVCDSQAVKAYSSTQDAFAGLRTTVFGTSDTSDPTCTGSNISATVTVLKQTDGSTRIYADGYNTCNASSNTRIERGLKVHY